jgi:nucleotide-binding universal stress UspA family protein
MKRFKNILLLSDGHAESRVALERAVALARTNEGRLTVVGVLQSLPRDLQLLSAAMPLGNLQEAAMHNLRQQLASFVAPFREGGPPIFLDVLCGKPFLEIIRTVQQRQYDLVILTAEGWNGLAHMLFGSTSLHLMRKCPCPVWVIKPSQEPRFNRILAAIDPDPLDVVCEGVNIKVMELASSLAELDGSELHVVHAWEFCDQTTLQGLSDSVSEAQVADLMAKTGTAHQQRFDQFMCRFDLKTLKHQLHLVQGEVGTVIPQVADQQKIDLIVMGTLARTGLAGYFIGNTAEMVLQRVGCSVLTVKPDGFVSPVKPD